VTPNCGGPWISTGVEPKIWQVALKDPRIMAELNQALGVRTLRDISPYY